MVVVICLLISAVGWAWHDALRENERGCHDSIFSLMRSIEYAILSGRTADVTAILHEQSDQIAENEDGDWRTPYANALVALNRLATNNDATNDAKRRAKY